MVDNSPSLSEIVNQLPLKLQQRFDSLGGYIQGIIEEEGERQDGNIILSLEDKQVIQLAVFVYSLDTFLRAGSRAAREASVTFERLGLSGFQVGSTHFTSDNLNTQRGELLADALRQTVSQTSLDRYIRNARSMKDLVTWLIRDMRNEQSLG